VTIPVTEIMQKLNNSNEAELLGERKLTKKQLTPIHNCSFLVSYYDAIKNKTNSIQTIGESKKNSPNINKANTINTYSVKGSKGLSNSEFLENEKLITQNKFYNISADVASDVEHHVMTLSAIHTVEKFQYNATNIF